MPSTSAPATLAAIGVKTIEDLFDEIPASLRGGGLSGIPSGVNEMEITRLGRDDPASSGQAWVARLSSTDLEVTPSEEQAASITGPGEQWTFDWNVLSRTGDAASSLTLSQRSYEDGSIEDTILLARFLTFEVRRPLLSTGLAVFGLAAGVGFLILARRGGG